MTTREATMLWFDRHSAAVGARMREIGAVEAKAADAQRRRILRFVEFVEGRA